MSKLSLSMCFASCGLILAAASLPVWAVDVVSSSGGGPTAATLALDVVNSTSGVTYVSGSAGFTINATGSPSSNLLAIGSFTNGITASGTLLPADNQNAGGTAAYSGGIGTDTGVVLCTGLVRDADASPPSPTGRGVGVEGPNNGTGGVNAGEIGSALGTPDDQDFINETGLPSGGDATVLEFDVQTTAPAYLRCSFVFGSDEHPDFITESFNDSFALFIDGENVATITKNSVVSPFSLQEVESCPALFRENDVAPAPAALVGSPHSISGASLYDVEFGGFTVVLTRETTKVLAPGTYTVKIVVQDVSDTNVDAGLFIPTSTLKAYTFIDADFNLDGKIDAADAGIWTANFGMTNPCFTDGDANGDGSVDAADFGIMSGVWGQTGGNVDYQSDFNRSGSVDGADFLIWQQYSGLTQCASRFEGDADGDGDVDGDDYNIWQAGQ